MKKHLTLIKNAVILVIIAAAIAIGAHVIHAQQASVTVSGISGFAWSDMPNTSNEAYPTGKTGQVGRGAGWISMNGSIGTSSGFGGNVTVNPATGELHGYAWTPNMGWIRFDPSGPYPAMPNPNGNLQPQGGGNGSVVIPPSNPSSSGGGSILQQSIPAGGGAFLQNIFQRILGVQKAYASATTGGIISLANGRWSGWARACAVFQSGCDGALAPSESTGGWDGWIALSGDTSLLPQFNQHFGVMSNLTTGITTGWAWGGDIMGWINFDNVILAVTPFNTCIGSDGVTYSYTGTGLAAMPVQCRASIQLLCADVTADNFGGPAPCTHNAICNISTASNYGQRAACIFPPNICNNPLASNYGQAGRCIIPIMLPASATLSQANLDCATGTVTIRWSTTGVGGLGSCTASTSGTSGISGFSGPLTPASGGSAQVTGIPQNGQVNNFTISCNAPGHTPRNPTASVSVMCPVPATPCDPATDPNQCLTPVGIPHPIYKEN